jgi:hypothetical protein
VSYAGGPAQTHSDLGLSRRKGIKSCLVKELDVQRTRSSIILILKVLKMGLSDYPS